MKKPDSPLYLAVKHQRKPDDDLWYMRCPLGKNEIGKFLSTAAKNASLQGRVTNHSVRKTCISRLLDANVSNNFVAQLSGHRNLKSLDAYKSASYNHQQRMSLAPSLRSRLTKKPLLVPPLLLPPLSLLASIQSSWDRVFFSGATIGSFNNCTFNIQLTSGQHSQQSNPDFKHPRIESDGQMQ